MHPYERWILRRYLANALRASRFARPPRRDKDIASWIESHARLLGLPDLALGAGSSGRSRGLDGPIDSASWRAFRAAMIVATREPAPKPSPLQRRLDWLAEACCLTEAHNSVLGLMARASQTPHVSALVEAVNDRLEFGSADGSELFPLLETNAERRELAAGGRLCQLGLIEASEAPRPSVLVRRLLALPRFGARRVGDLLLGRPARASLGWSDFEHLGDLRDLAARIVAAAGKLGGAGRRGANLLFYGAPGNDADGAAPLPLRLHDQRAGPARRGGGAAVPVQGALPADDGAADRASLSPRVRRRGSRLRPQTRRL